MWKKINESNEKEIWNGKERKKEWKYKTMRSKEEETKRAGENKFEEQKFVRKFPKSFKIVPNSESVTCEFSSSEFWKVKKLFIFIIYFFILLFIVANTIHWQI